MRQKSQPPYVVGFKILEYLIQEPHVPGTASIGMTKNQIMLRTHQNYNEITKRLGNMIEKGWIKTHNHRGRVHYICSDEGRREYEKLKPMFESLKHDFGEDFPWWSHEDCETFGMHS